MSEPTVIIAKHIADRFRQEARNVGVIVFANGTVRARFLGEDSTDGRMNLNRVPAAVIKDKQAYKQWVDYWRECLTDPERYITTGPGLVRIGSPRHHDTLLADNAAGQYFLSGGMTLFESISPERHVAAVDDIFSRLVLPEEMKGKDEALRECIDRIIDRRHLADNEHFVQHYRPDGSPFHYDYVCLGRDMSPRRIWQRVSTYGRTIERDVAAGAYRILRAERFGIRRQDAFAVINCSPEEAASHAAQLRAIEEVATVINLGASDAQEALFAEVLELAGA